MMKTNRIDISIHPPQSGSSVVSWKPACFSGTVRRFLENHGNGIEAVVFAVTETEEVCLTSVLNTLLHHHVPAERP